MTVRRMARRTNALAAIAPLVILAGCGDNASAPPSADSGPSSRDAGSNACQGQCEGSDGEAPLASDARSLDANGDTGSDAGTANDGGADSGPEGPPQSVGGQLFGLTPGEAITLQNNLGDTLTLSSSGPFSFATPVPGNRSYDVTILTPPSNPIAQTCTVWDGTGTAGTAPVNDIRVNCDLLAYFPFAGNAKDASGYGHDGVVTGATLTADRNGNADSAYTFSNSAFVQAAMPVGFLPISDEPRTLAAWLRPSQSNSALDVIFWGEGNCTGLQFGLGDEGDKAAFWGGCDDYSSALQVPVSAWTFVAIVYSPATPTTILVYANDAPATGTITPLMTSGSATFIIGGSTGSSFFSGDIDSVRVYGHALTPAEVSSLRTALDP